MRDDYLYDVFISYSHYDEENVREIYEKLTMDLGLRVFWSTRKLPKGIEYPPELDKALKGSQHFVLYYSKKSIASEWVSKESDLFLTTCHSKDKDNRRMYVLLHPECAETDLPAHLRDFNRPRSLEDLIAALVRSLGRELEQASVQQNRMVARLREELEQEKQRKVAEAQQYYRYNRFWGPIAENRDVHIFTCGRDVSYDSQSSRGYGGRTNIDLWDYRVVLDITHFFTSNYPNTRVTIEEPMSKLRDQDLEQVARLANQIANMRNMLADKDCIIIGSPDVSDFAELILAEIHQITPYTEGRVKRKGFVIIKERQHTRSSFYWQKEAKEQEGAAEILGPDDYHYYPSKLATEDGNPGTVYGILVVANNPFCTSGTRRKVIILSGFTGVATNGIAKILTDERCLPEFFRLDNAYENPDRDIEALIGVRYIIGRGFDRRDARQITDYKSGITFESLVEI